MRLNYAKLCNSQASNMFVDILMPHAKYGPLWIHRHISGGSRISRRGVMDLRHGHFPVKMYAKMTELGPMGGGMCLACPPRSANAYLLERGANPDL